MAPSMAAMLRAPDKLCSLSSVLFVMLVFLVLDVVSLIVYDRRTLLEIRSVVTNRKPDFEFRNAGTLTRHQSPLSGMRSHDHANAAAKEGREPASSSDLNGVPTGLRYQPFCCPMFNHWTINSVNYVRVSPINEKLETAALSA